MKRKVTRRQAHQLLQIFLHMGQEVVAPLCVECGVAAHYAQRCAYELGLMKKKTRGSGNASKKVNHSDHRWKWAEARGTIIA